MTEQRWTWALCLVWGVAAACSAPNPLNVANGKVGTDSAASDTGSAAQTDSDGDGVAAALDCNDADPLVYPGAPEVCNDQDDDCDGIVDNGLPTETWFVDSDGDGFGSLTDVVEACAAPPSFVANDWDCDDADDTVHPGAEESCGTGDRNCDGVLPPPCGSCADVLEGGLSEGDGVYTVTLDTTGTVDVWCDMTTDGGGWTLVQRTVWDWGESQALLTDYASWYSATVGSPEPGRAFRLAGKAWGELARGREHLLRATPRVAESGDSCDVLRYIGTGGRVLVSSHAAYITGLSSELRMLSSDTLSTTDQGPAVSCVGSHAVPWFYGGCCSTCPTYQGSYWADAPHPMASDPLVVPDISGHTVSEACGEADASLASGGGFVGLNTLDYLVR